MVQTGRTRHSRWTIMRTDFFEELCEHRAGSFISQADGSLDPIDFPAWASVHSVIMPICVLETHWVVGELNLDEMLLTIYDADQANTFDRALNYWLRVFHTVLEEFLLSIGERSRAARAGSVTHVMAPNIPQCGWIGACGPMTCQMLSLLGQGRIPSQATLTETPEQTRIHMANIFWQMLL